MSLGFLGGGFVFLSFVRGVLGYQEVVLLLASTVSKRNTVIINLK